MASEVECVVPAGDICGEGAVWHPEQEALYWTDVNRFLVHRYSPSAKTTQSWLFEEPVVSVNLTTTSDRLLLVLATQIAFWDPSEAPRIGDNSCAAHSSGHALQRCQDLIRADRFGAGTMRNNVGPSGENLDVEFTDAVLYRLDPDGSVTEWMHQIGISNTVAWSPDQSTFYFWRDYTIANALYAFAFDQETREPSPREGHFFVDFEHGLPDGSAMDAEGCLWNTRPNASCLARIRPDGKIDRLIPLPVLKPTTCAFGGPDLRTLFITSARSEERLSGGSLFSLRARCAWPADRTVLAADSNLRRSPKRVKQSATVTI